MVWKSRDQSDNSQIRLFIESSGLLTSFGALRIFAGDAQIRLNRFSSKHDVAACVHLDITSFSNVPFPPPPNGCSNGVESVQRMLLRNDHVDRHSFHVQ